MEQTSSIVAKIRHLLAKAERTEFTEEAEAFLAKATDLIAKYRVDAAVLEASGKAANDPVERTTITIGSYHIAKGQLAVALAQVLDCHVLWGSRRGKSRSLVVVGHTSDLATFGALMTSLELQLDRELLRVSGYDGGDTKARRTSFSRGWSHRVSERITEHYNQASEEAVAATAESSSVALVLAERADVVAAKYEEFYGRKPSYTRKTHHNSRLSEYGRGHQAGGRADIGAKGVSGATRALST